MLDTQSLIQLKGVKRKDGRTMLAQEHRCWKVEPTADGDKKQQKDDNLIF